MSPMSNHDREEIRKEIRSLADDFKSAIGSLVDQLRDTHTTSLREADHAVRETSNGGGSPNSENLRVAVGPFVHPNGNAGDAQQMDGAAWRGHRDSRPGPFWSGEPEQDFLRVQIVADLELLGAVVQRGHDDPRHCSVSPEVEPGPLDGLDDLRAQLAAYYDSQAGEMRMRIITDTTDSLLRFLSEPLPASSNQLCDLTFQLLDCLHQQIERVRQVRVGLNDLGRSDVAADTSGGVAHNDSSTSAEQPESVPAITVEAKRRGGGDTGPCARGGAA